MTYRETWPHEYVVVRRDRQQALLDVFCARIARGEGVEYRFFGQSRRYLFLGDHTYWTMTDCADIDLDAEDFEITHSGCSCSSLYVLVPSQSPLAYSLEYFHHQLSVISSSNRYEVG